MAPSSNRKTKSSRKKREESKFDNLQSLTLADVQCTACMGIFIEPVTLPCYHAMCKECFQKTIDNNPLNCPLCRKYIGGWIRQVQKTGTIVNDSLWLHIQTKFATNVQKKLAGEEDEEMEELSRQLLPTPQICLPGVIRQEYEEEQEKVRAELRQRERAELEASEKLILQLQEVEERKREQERLESQQREEEDARIAKQLAEELENQVKEVEIRSAFVSLNKSGPSNPSGPPVIRGPMDAFISQSPAISRADSSCSNDSLQSELQHFKPVMAAPCTPPKTLPNGKTVRALPIKVPVMRDLDAVPGTSRQSFGTVKSPLRPWAVLTHSPWASSTSTTNTRNESQSSKGVLKRLSADSATNSPKRICPEWTRSNAEEDDDDDEGYAGSDRSKEQDGTEVDGSVLSLTESEMRLQLAAAERLRQESLDRDLAVRLQAQLDAETTPVYQLRSADAKSTPRRKAQPRKKTSSTPRDNRRQRTLEETMGVSRHSLRTTLK